MRYNNILNSKVTTQSAPIPGKNQVANSAGGYVWEVNDWTRLRRFLILGTEGGSYYASETKLTLENAEAIKRCLALDGVRVVKEIVAISDAGRAAKNDPALFALAMCTAFGDDITRKAALEALPTVARIGTHLFHFAEYVNGMRGWGRGLRNAVANWYDRKPNAELASQLVKYRQRDGWSHRDLLRLAHPKTDDATRNALYHWVVDGWEGVGEVPHPDQVLRTIWAFEQIQRAKSGVEAAKLVREFALPIEVVPTELRDRGIWEAVLPHAGPTFLLRNLGNLSKIGLLTKGAWDAFALLREKLTIGALRKARVHPIQILSALITYRQGHGSRGKGEWEAVPEVIDILDKAFYTAFDTVKPSGKRWVLALDVSGSMGMGEIAGVPGLTPRVGSAAMAMITYKVEAAVEIIAFSTKLMRIDLSRQKRLDDVVKAVDGLPFSGTDCAQPMLWAMENKVKADVFVVYTDSETWHGTIHPTQALDQYRQKTGIPARLAVVGMTANKFSIADPNDAGMLDVVGFDTAAPDLIREFAMGSL